MADSADEITQDGKQKTTRVLMEILRFLERQAEQHALQKRISKQLNGNKNTKAKTASKEGEADIKPINIEDVEPDELVDFYMTTIKSDPKGEVLTDALTKAKIAHKVEQTTYGPKERPAIKVTIPRSQACETLDVCSELVKSVNGMKWYRFPGIEELEKIQAEELASKNTIFETTVTQQEMEELCECFDEAGIEYSATQLQDNNYVIKCNGKDLAAKLNRFPQMIKDLNNGHTHEKVNARKTQQKNADSKVETEPNINIGNKAKDKAASAVTKATMAEEIKKAKETLDVTKGAQIISPTKTKSL
jgi:hypothetical protein